LQQLWRKAKSQAVLKSIQTATKNKKAGRLKATMFQTAFMLMQWL
jgi:hypothetical protein